MAVIAENFTIQQGETFSKDFILKNPDSSLIGISSYTASAFLAKYAGKVLATDKNGGVRRGDAQNPNTPAETPPAPEELDT